MTKKLGAMAMVLTLGAFAVACGDDGDDDDNGNDTSTTRGASTDGEGGSVDDCVQGLHRLGEDLQCRL